MILSYQLESKPPIHKLSLQDFRREPHTKKLTEKNFLKEQRCLDHHQVCRMQLSCKETNTFSSSFPPSLLPLAQVLLTLLRPAPPHPTPIDSEKVESSEEPHPTLLSILMTQKTF